MKISQENFNVILKSLVDSGFIGKVSPENPDELAAHYLDTKRLDEQIQSIENYQTIQGSFLEIGSGFGGMVTYLNTKYKNKCQILTVRVLKFHKRKIKILLWGGYPFEHRLRDWETLLLLTIRGKN